LIASITLPSVNVARYSRSDCSTLVRIVCRRAPLGVLLVRPVLRASAGPRSVRSASLFVPATGSVSPLGCKAGLAHFRWQGQSFWEQPDQPIPSCCETAVLVDLEFEVVVRTTDTRVLSLPSRRKRKAWIYIAHKCKESSWLSTPLTLPKQAKAGPACQREFRYGIHVGQPATPVITARTDLSSGG
jgi:hypothetical protein